MSKGALWTREILFQDLWRQHEADAVPIGQMLLGLHPLTAAFGFRNDAQFFTFGDAIAVRSSFYGKGLGGEELNSIDFGCVLVCSQEAPVLCLERDLP